MSEIYALIQNLIASGQLGVIIIALAFVMGGAIWVIYYQSVSDKVFFTLKDELFSYL
jgi:hypothetical protein